MKTAKKRELSTTQLIALGFLLAIIIGTFLLMLPFSSASGEMTSPINALFTATTSVCVTGLVVVDTYSYWSIWGQIIILCLIQVGGLGIITLTTFVMTLIGRRVSLKDRLLLEDAFNLNTLSGLVKFLKKVVKGTFLIEMIGAVCYLFVFVPEYGVKGIWISFFTAISAFCNAGIDIIGNASLSPYVTNVWINLVTMFLIIMGGIGFIVWLDVVRVVKGLSKKEIRIHNVFLRLALHSKIVLVTTVFLIFFGAFMIFILEYNNPETLGNYSIGNKMLISLFQSVTLRTAGFATISQKGLHASTLIICFVWMFIGGSPVGTAGGVKTTTVATLFFSACSTVKGEEKTSVYHKTIKDYTIRKSLAVVLISLCAIALATTALEIAVGGSMEDVAYEIISAIGTVGLTRDYTSGVNFAGKIIIIICMYLGRIGPISMAILFQSKKGTKGLLTYPTEEITVG